ncbi:VOC family protein [Grimontia sp. NTOU-MAR1]|nr:VOC family protein [Grimontia sp. NTOU-MAR1]WRV98016.1 VOC family protein [Grimontia sp. NTOU-MAR1]
MNPVGWFEIAVSEMDRAMAFYEEALGLTLSKQEVGGLSLFLQAS